MGEQTWAGAAREVWRSAVRHKAISGLIALCVAGSLAGIGLASQNSGAATPASTGNGIGGLGGVGGTAPTFSLPVLGNSGGNSGREVTLADYAGKPLIVNFFASWCEPCKTETPLLAKFYRGERGKVALVGLDENDGLGSATSFTRADGVSYPVGWDPHLIAASAYGVYGLPQTFFLDARHHIVDRVFGAVTQSALRKGIALATGS
jgi:cytochrome c biogenesis protein CcmG/thiol:disulfide interchange protein DsbE